MQVSGELQYVEANYSNFRPRNSKIVAVLEQDLFRRAVVDHLYGLREVKGIAVLWERAGDSGSSEGHSPEERAPNKGVIRGYAGDGYEWNPTGDGLLYRHYKIPIWLVEENHTETVRARAKENGGDTSAGNATNTVTGMIFHTRMDGGRDTATCFRRETCLPMGGQSVISSLSTLTDYEFVNESESESASGSESESEGSISGGRRMMMFPAAKRVVYVTARMDTTSFFHDIAYGAEGYTSGLVVTLAAQAALSARLRAAPRPLARNIIFAYFNGESYGYLGSRKYVHDLQNIKCERENGYGGCEKPFIRSLRFMNETLDKVDAVIDVGQVGLVEDSKLYVHTLRNESAGYERYFRAAEAASADLNVSFEYLDPEADRGVPPSSALAFEEAFAKGREASEGSKGSESKESGEEGEEEEELLLPIFVLADHEDAFHNKHYMSHLDRKINKEGLCGTATLLTRTLYRLAVGGEDAEGDEISADCGLVEELAGCLTENFKCPIAENLLGNMTASDGSEVVQISKYASIYGSSEKGMVVGTIQRFVRLFTLRYAAMDIGGTNCTSSSECPMNYECVGMNDNGTCVRGITEYHSAISLGVQYKDGQWKVTDKTQPLWAESK